MKRRNRANRRRAQVSRQALPSLFAQRDPRKRRAYSFEHLEERLAFSAAPLELQTSSISSDTAEGAAALLLRELQWAAMQSATMNPVPDGMMFELPTDPYVPRPGDPSIQGQWHLLNIGQEVGSPNTEFQRIYGVPGEDINVFPVWQGGNGLDPNGYSGEGILVAVIDNGTLMTHPDLVGNLHPTLRFSAIDGTDNVYPTIFHPVTGELIDTAWHGTAVAGLIGATWSNEVIVTNNDEDDDDDDGAGGHGDDQPTIVTSGGGVGVAPGVTLVPILMVDPNTSIYEQIGDVPIGRRVAAFRYAMIADVDIMNNSWGPASDRAVSPISDLELDTLRQAAIFGRDGLGIITVFSSGNNGGPVLGTGFPSLGNYDSAAYNPLINSRYTIAVTGVDHDGLYANSDGTVSSYAEAGPNVLVAAPTGSNPTQTIASDDGNGSGIWTTDLVGNAGRNGAPDPITGIDEDGDYLEDVDYTSRLGGTSSAAPLVSGVIALMLEANPNLTYRDIQEILVRSARQNAPFEIPANAIGGGLFLGAGGSAGSGGNTTSDGSNDNLGGGSGGAATDLDFGDAPESYSTLLPNGPRHRFALNNLTLGSFRDAELDGLPSAGADGDDLATSPDDEDGVAVTPLIRGQTATWQVNAPTTGGQLTVWVDFDRDGVFDNPSERVITNQVLTQVSTPISIPVPAGASLGTTFARFRLSSAGTLNPGGEAPDGEVEDYQVVIQSPTVTTGFTIDRGYSTWQTNQNAPFRDPDPWGPPIPPALRVEALFNPFADPRDGRGPIFGTLAGFSPSQGNDFGRLLGHYELQPGEFANGAGYTVSQGYGAYSELLGYGHGVIDAELAVKMAEEWHNLNQDIPRLTERTWTTFVVAGGLNLPAAEEMADDGLLVPGGIGGDAGFIAHWNEYFVDDDPAVATDGPFSSDDPPLNTRGASYIDFTVPINQQMNVEWVEVKIAITGPGADLDFLKINLTSPSGMQSELNHYYADDDFIPFAIQDGGLSAPIAAGDPAGDINTGNTFVWTFATNRSWGESTNSAVIIDPLTGEPVPGPSSGGIPQPVFRDWELHIENWSNSQFILANVEIVWHGKPIAGGEIDQRWEARNPLWNIPVAQRIQGVVGIDADNDAEFSGIADGLGSDENEFNVRYIQTALAPGTNPAAFRATDLVRRPLGSHPNDFLDVNNNEIFDEGDVPDQEPFAANVLVQAFRFTLDGLGNRVEEAEPIAQFLTGADGNYYFDLVPGNYVIRATDLENGLLPGQDTRTAGTNDLKTATFQPHYWDEWVITPDWFYAPNREVPVAGNPGEIPFGTHDNDGQNGATRAPQAFLDFGLPIPMAVQNINFLLKQTTTSSNSVTINGSVIADVNGNSQLDTFEGGAGNMRVYHDEDRNGQFNAGEDFVTTMPDGSYSITINIAEPTAIDLGVFVEPGWAPSQPGGDVKHFFLAPTPVGGMPVTDQFFFLNPPDDPTGTGLGNITGFVFNDLDADGMRDPGENALPNSLRVFIDVAGPGGVGAPDGIFNTGEKFAFTSPQGGFFLPDVAAGTHLVRIEFDATLLDMTTPTAELHTIVLTAGETRNGVAFGFDNLADRDFGDLAGTFNNAGTPSHFVVSHFKLGANNDGDLPGQLPNADNSDDDGVSIFGGGNALHPGTNTISVTVTGVGGYFSGWIDWNNSGTFEEATERLEFTDLASGEFLGEQADIGPGTHKLTFNLPDTPDVATMIGARFRWGEFGLGLGTQASIGEVEDYLFNSLPTIVAAALPGDYNNDGSVNAADYVLYRKLFGTGGSMPNSTTPGTVVAADYPLWVDFYGETDGGGAGGAAGQSASTEPPAEVAPSVPDEVYSVSQPVVVTAPQTSPSVTVADAPAETTKSPIDSTPKFSPLFASMNFESSASVSTAPAKDAARSKLDTREVKRSDADILLVFDKALAELEEAEDDAPIADRSHGDDEGYSDVALAAVFADESAWWSL